MSPTGRGSNPAPPIAAAFLDTRYIRALVFLKHFAFNNLQQESPKKPCLNKTSRDGEINGRLLAVFC